MEQQKQAIEEANQIIDLARTELNRILKPYPNLAMRVDSTFDTLASGLSFTVGEVYRKTEQTATTVSEPKPITQLLDMAINTNASKPVTAKNILPTDADKALLHAEILKAYSSFRERDNAEIKAALEDITIRGVAKRAGMNVTSTEPGVITLEFIQLIKEAIRIKEELKATTAGAQSGIDKETGAPMQSPSAVNSPVDTFSEGGQSEAEEKGAIIHELINTGNSLALEAGQTVPEENINELKSVLKNLPIDELKAFRSNFAPLKLYFVSPDAPAEEKKEEARETAILTLIALCRSMATSKNLEFTKANEEEIIAALANMPTDKIEASVLNTQALIELFKDSPLGSLQFDITAATAANEEENKVGTPAPDQAANAEAATKVKADPAEKKTGAKK